MLKNADDAGDLIHLAHCCKTLRAT